jgi:hypothetical protein
LFDPSLTHLDSSSNSNGWTLEWGSAYIQVRDENGDFVAGWDPGKMNYVALAED